MFIRPYTLSDYENIIVLLRLNTPKYFAPDEEADLKHYLSEEIDFYFVVEENNEIIGCGGINIVDNGKIARISWDIIHPDYQDKGVGRKLTQYRIERIKEIPGIETIVVRTSQLVYLFYQKFGFSLKKWLKTTGLRALICM